MVVLALFIGIALRAGRRKLKSKYRHSPFTDGGDPAIFRDGTMNFDMQMNASKNNWYGDNIMHVVDGKPKRGPKSRFRDADEGSSSDLHGARKPKGKWGEFTDSLQNSALMSSMKAVARVFKRGGRTELSTAQFIEEEEEGDGRPQLCMHAIHTR